jgi:hypothetical protein
VNGNGLDFRIWVASRKLRCVENIGQFGLPEQ